MKAGGKIKDWVEHYAEQLVKTDPKIEPVFEEQIALDLEAAYKNEQFDDYYNKLIMDNLGISKGFDKNPEEKKKIALFELNKLFNAKQSLSEFISKLADIKEEDKNKLIEAIDKVDTNKKYIFDAYNSICYHEDENYPNELEIENIENLKEAKEYDATFFDRHINQAIFNEINYITANDDNKETYLKILLFNLDELEKADLIEQSKFDIKINSIIQEINKTKSPKGQEEQGQEQEGQEEQELLEPRKKPVEKIIDKYLQDIEDIQEEDVEAIKNAFEKSQRNKNDENFKTKISNALKLLFDEKVLRLEEVSQKEEALKKFEAKKKLFEGCYDANSQSLKSIVQLQTKIITPLKELGKDNLQSFIELMKDQSSQPFKLSKSFVEEWARSVANFYNAVKSADGSKVVLMLKNKDGVPVNLAEELKKQFGSKKIAGVDDNLLSAFNGFLEEIILPSIQKEASAGDSGELAASIKSSIDNDPKIVKKLLAVGLPSGLTGASAAFSGIIIGTMFSLKFKNIITDAASKAVFRNVDLGNIALSKMEKFIEFGIKSLKGQRNFIIALIVASTALLGTTILFKKKIIDSAKKKSYEQFSSGFVKLTMESIKKQKPNMDFNR